jgi:crotonobetaine/carnitine-CoA ligase
VELRPGAALTAPELAGWLAPRLARYQLPRYIDIVPGFERTPSQRMKHRLSPGRDDCWDRLAGA